MLHECSLCSENKRHLILTLDLLHRLLHNRFGTINGRLITESQSIRGSTRTFDQLPLACEPAKTCTAIQAVSGLLDVLG